ncbi:unnamed protein product [Rotaria sordida]|uniref:Uncharacterized protein n=1 Tax=Rotaria sordida TaxID=392033 RepID=A0A813Z2J0_9BILA|nr:unnamed protein product [Rotaria sordida]CAF0892075.1 unnamed protein product [Rotaria sordida]
MDPAMFYTGNIRANLAALFNISLDKIRRVSIISASNQIALLKNKIYVDIEETVSPIDECRSNNNEMAFSSELLYSIDDGNTFFDALLIRGERTKKNLFALKLVDKIFSGEELLELDPIKKTSTHGTSRLCIYTSCTGVLVHSIDMDDYTGQSCHRGAFPITSVISDIFFTSISSIKTATNNISSVEKTKICVAVDKIYYLPDENDVEYFYICLPNQQYPAARFKCEKSFIFSEQHQAYLFSKIFLQALINPGTDDIDERIDALRFDLGCSLKVYFVGSVILCIDVD